MTLLFLYGPPAAGKLTVAREVERLVGFRVFHNHLTIELALEVFGERNTAFGELVTRLRLDTIEAAARADVSLIFTLVYCAGKDDDYVRDVVDAVERHGGRVAFVQLLAEMEAIRARLDAPSRRAFSKIKSWETLERVIAGCDLITPIPGSLSLDTTDLPPGEAAARIVAHFGLGA